MRLVRPTLLVDLNRAGLDSIEANGVVRIGATVRQAALEHDPRTHPLLREALPHVGHFVTRNRGTVGGSVAHADGAAEIPLCLAALGGAVVVEGPVGGREIAPADFFVTHYLTTLAPGELVVETSGPARRRTRASRSRSSRFAPGTTVSRWWRSRSGASTASPAMCGCGSGAVTDRPTALAEVEEAVAGAPLTDAAAREAGRLAADAVDPPGSIHASAAYLRHLTGTLVERALLRAWERAA